MKELTPKKIVKELDKYIIGQKEAKKSVAIALRNWWRRQQVEEPLRNEISPNNIILIGGGGHAKSCIDVIELEKKYKICGVIDFYKSKKKLVRFSQYTNAFAHFQNKLKFGGHGITFFAVY